MIGDIEGLRDNDQALLAAETKEFKSYNYFIVHNQRMADWLKKITPHCTLTNIDFFDYLVNSVTTERKLLPEIAFAGNLKKSSFLSELHLLSGKKPELHFILYGPGITEEIKSYQNVTYFGIFKPYEMPSKIEGSFGLIWDGVSIDTCSGSYGDYLRINTQHKLSLYIVSGLPVIVWEEAATAAFVKQYKIGITIKSLYEISDKIKSISFADYVTMRKNMMPIADKIRRGFYLSNALENLMEF
ncbi:MAG: hypothetical protein ABUT20_30485 [Bacteroidota bacterium]